MDYHHSNDQQHPEPGPSSFPPFAHGPYNFPPPPALTPAPLFAPEETTDLFGFLDQFGTANGDSFAGGFWDYPQGHHYEQQPPAHYDGEHFEYPQALSLPPTPHQHSVTPTPKSAPPHYGAYHPFQQPPPPPPPHSSVPTPTPDSQPQRSKPLLSTPQKRLNHIMSEQKRRNAIRDGYAQLLHLLGDPSSAMPSRGRPKGRGKNTKGKSGVLFRAVEYVRWLEQGRDALRDEVDRWEQRQ